MNDGWIGVDLDGTLAHYDKWVQWNSIGKPIPLMVERIRSWLKEDREVKIFTARVAFEKDVCYVTNQVFTREALIAIIQDWCEEHVQKSWRPEVTAIKDYRMIELWDDRCIQVIPNTGRVLRGELDAISLAHTGKAWAP